MFKNQIGRNMEVYVNDMLVKSLRIGLHFRDLEETFNTLRKYKMRLNPVKCTFGVSGEKFLGFMVSQRGIESNPKKGEAIMRMESPQNTKEVQKLARRVAALNRFISKSTDKCLPFFCLLRKAFEWTKNYEEAFQKLKEHLASLPLLCRTEPNDSLLLYVAVSDSTMSSVLINEEASKQRPVYYVSWTLTRAEWNYPKVEKVAFPVVITTQKQAHVITVLTNQPLKYALQQPKTSGRLIKW